MTPALEFVIGKATLDKPFREQLFLDPKMALQNINLNLVGEELDNLITQIKSFSLSDKFENIEIPMEFWD